MAETSHLTGIMDAAGGFSVNGTTVLDSTGQVTLTQTATGNVPSITVTTAATTVTGGVLKITGAGVTTGCAIKITLAALTTGAAIDTTGLAANTQVLNVNSSTGSTAAPQTNAPTGFFKIGVAGTDRWVPFYSAT